MALTQTQVSQLYVAIFNRTSEGEGNQYWQNQPDAAAAATAMLDTTDAKQYFGASLDTDQAFIEMLFGRIGGADGAWLLTFGTPDPALAEELAGAGDGLQGQLEILGSFWDAGDFPWLMAQGA